MSAKPLHSSDVSFFCTATRDWRKLASRIFVVQWAGWRRFLRDFVVIQIGFFFFGLSIDIVVQAGIGTAPWVVLEKGLTNHISLSLGQANLLVAFLIILFDVILKEPLGWGSVSNMLFVGLWVDLLRPFVPAVPPIMWIQVLYLLLGALVMGFATAVYVGVNAGAGPRDSLMLAISRMARVSLRGARTILETSVVVIGWLLGGPVWLGTVIFALAIGPSVQLAFRLLRINPPKWNGARPTGHESRGLSVC